MKKCCGRVLGMLFWVLGGVFLPFSGQAQTLIPFELEWRTGTLILTNGDTIRGRTSLTLPNDVVKVSPTNGESRVFLPTEITSLEVREPINKFAARVSSDPLLQNRKYGQYTWNRDNDYATYKAPALFVVVVSGKYDLLVREERQQQQTAGGGSVAGQALSQGMAAAAEQTIIEKIYLALPNHEVKWLRHPRKDFLKYFPEQEKVLKKYAQEQGLGFGRLDHLAKIVAYCNTL